MKTPTALLILTLIAGRMESAELDKAKLRELVQLPAVSVSISLRFRLSSTFGLSINSEKPDPAAEIARLRKQLKGDAGDVDILLNLGRLYGKLDRKKESKDAYAQAVELCRRQVREHPKGMHWLARLGDALTYQGETEEGEKLLRRAVKEAPNDWWAWSALAVCVDGKSIQAVMGNEAFSFHLKDSNSFIRPLLQRKLTAEQIATMRRLRAEAQHYYARAIELAPREKQPYINRLGSLWVHAAVEAGLRMAKGEKINLKAALLTPQYFSDMSQIARLSPDDPKTVGTAAIVDIITCALHSELDPNAEGNPLVDHLPTHNREFVRWAMNRLEQLEQSPDKSKAADAAEAAAELLLLFKGPEGKPPILPASFRPEGEKESKQKILDHLQRVIRLDPSRDRAWDCLTGLLIEMDKSEEAAAACQKRIETKDSAHNRFLLAKVYAEKSQFDRAAEQLRAGVKREPNDLDCRLGLAAVLLKRDDASSLKQAGEQLDAAEPRLKEEKGKEHQTVYLLLRGIHAALNDRPREAKRLFEQVLGRDKGNTTAARGLAILGSQGGSPDKQSSIDYLRKQGGRIRRGSKSSGSPVVEVRLSGDKFTDEDLFFVTAFPSLREVDLFGQSFTDAGTIYLNQLGSLRQLTLSYTKITDAGLGRLEGLRNLEILRIDDNAFRAESPTITAAGLAHLRKLPNLRDVSVVSLTDRGLAELAAIPRLRRLHASFNKITDEGMSQLEGCRELRELEFFDGDFTDTGLTHLKKLPNLRVLNLSYIKITDAGLAHLKRLRNLRSLVLCKTKITDAGLVHLKELKKLEELDLSDTVITDAGLAHLRELTDLRDLVLSSRFSGFAASMEAIARFPGAPPAPAKKPPLPRITDAGLKQLAGLAKLECLELHGHPITDAGLAHLRGLSNLRWLFLDSTRITDAGLLTIEKLTRLERLSLDGANITDAALNHLHGLKRLEFVSLRGTKVTREGIDQLRKARSKLDISR